MKLLVIVVGLGVLVLAMIVGQRMSTEAMGVVVGIVCGIGAAIPVTLLMIYLVGRRNDVPAQPQQPTATYYVETMQVLQLPPGRLPDGHNVGAYLLPRRTR